MPRTTGLNVELLLVGTLTLAGLLSIVVAIIGTDPVVDLFDDAGLGGASIVVAVAFTAALAYPIGVIADRITDPIASWRLESWRQQAVKLELEVRHRATADLASVVDYFRGRVRIARSSALAFLLLAVGLAGIAVRGDGHVSIFASASLVSLALFVLGVFATWRLARTYRDRLETAHIIIHAGVDAPQCAFPSVDDDGGAEAHSPP